MKISHITESLERPYLTEKINLENEEANRYAETANEKQAEKQTILDRARTRHNR